MRSWGGEPVVMWRSLAPFSTIALSSWWRFAIVVLLEAVGRGVPHRLRQGRGPVLHLVERAHPEGAEAHPDGLLLQLRGGGAVDDELLQPVPHRHDLVDGHAPLEAAVVAVLAPDLVEGREGADLVGREAGVEERLLVDRRRRLAVG